MLDGWLGSVWRKAGPLIAATAAVAAGQPQLAVPAATAAAKTAPKKKTKALTIAPPVALAEPPGAGILAGFHNLPAADREILLVGGAVVATALAYRLTKPRGRP